MSNLFYTLESKGNVLFRACFHAVFMDVPLQKVVIQPAPKSSIQRIFQIKKYSKIGILLDENTEKYCYPHLRAHLPPHVLIRTRSGERFKTISTCVEIWHQFVREGFDRHSLILILGGGMLIDMGGFCAATFKRGVDFVFLPTTLLAQADAGVGGKLGVNFQAYKNQIGVFRDPLTTLIFTCFLDTLPPRVFHSGFAEILKHCLISDAARWHVIRRASWKDHDWKDMIGHSIRFKMKIVEADPYEEGSRKVLNFGHTIGHAVEHVLSARGILHGEAVAMGMIVESHIAFQKRYLDSDLLDQITHYILSVFGKCDAVDTGRMLDAVGKDKKNKGSNIMMTLIRDIGDAIWDVNVDKDEIYKSLDYYRLL